MTQTNFKTVLTTKWVSVFWLTVGTDSNDVIPIGAEPDTNIEDFNHETAQKFTLNTGSKAVGPNSFVDAYSEASEKCPPPKYLTDSYLQKPLTTATSDILFGFEETKDGALICTDKESLDA